MGGAQLGRRGFLGAAGFAGTTLSELASVDVLVAGGGPAGIGAAIAASRAGAKTLLIERHAFPGGVGAWGMGMVINQIRPENKPRGAVHELVVEKVAAYGERAMTWAGHAMVTNVEYLKAGLMDALDAAGVKYLLHCRVADTVVESGRVTGAIVSTKEGLRRVRAKVSVDATGDADLSYFARAETMKGRESDGFLSPMTLNLIVVNVDVPAAEQAMRGGGMKKLLDVARAKNPLLPETMGLARFPIDNAVTINHAGTKLRGPLDATSPEQITEAEKYSRHQAIQILEALREFGGPAFARAQLAASGPQVGVRETRRVKGLYALTEDDAKSGRAFEDAIAWRSGFLDIGFVRYEKMKVHDVPYRSIVPVKMDGLLMAGRCISATHVAAAAGKSMGNCMATGHAAGSAAVLSIEKKMQPRELRAEWVQAALRKDGVELNRAGEEGSKIG